MAMLICFYVSVIGICCIFMFLLTFLMFFYYLVNISVPLRPDCYEKFTSKMFDLISFCFATFCPSEEVSKSIGELEQPKSSVDAHKESSCTNTSRKECDKNKESNNQHYMSYIGGKMNKALSSFNEYVFKVNTVQEDLNSYRDNLEELRAKLLSTRSTNVDKCIEYVQEMDDLMQYFKLKLMSKVSSKSRTATITKTNATALVKQPPCTNSRSSLGLPITGGTGDNIYDLFGLNGKNYEKKLENRLIKSEDITVSWKDIGGLASTLESIKETILLPLEYSELVSQAPLFSTPKGILLHGPPGCGKTLIAKAIAKGSGLNFLNLDSAALLDKYYGESEKLIEAAFSLAKKMQPCIIFIDEIDSLLRTRQSDESETNRRVKNLFMTYCDGLMTQQKDKVILIGATNLIDQLDPAILRRLPAKYEIKVPIKQQRRQILEVILKPEKLAENVNLDQLADLTDGFTGSDLRDLCRDASSTRVRRFIADNNLAKDVDLQCEIKTMQEKIVQSMPVLAENQNIQQKFIHNLLQSFRPEDPKKVKKNETLPTLESSLKALAAPEKKMDLMLKENPTYSSFSQDFNKALSDLDTITFDNHAEGATMALKDLSDVKVTPSGPKVSVETINHTEEDGNNSKSSTDNQKLNETESKYEITPIEMKDFTESIRKLNESRKDDFLHNMYI